MSDPFCRKCRQPLGGRHVPDCIWEHTVVPSECTGVIEEAMATVKARKSADYARGVADERAAATVRVVTLLSTPLASKDFLEGVRRAMDRIRSGPSATAVDGEHEEAT